MPNDHTTTQNEKVAIFSRMYASVSAQSTPGLAEFIASRPAIKNHLDTLTQEIDLKAPGADFAEVEVLAATYIKWMRKASQRHAEEILRQHQAEGRPLDELDLRVARHLAIAIPLKDAGGRDYTLYGRLPDSVEPGYWGTAQDWLDALEHSKVIDAIVTFGRYPVHARALPPPDPGTGKLVLDFTGQKMVAKLEKSEQTSFNLPN
jgi:hypothetical protein